MSPIQEAAPIEQINVGHDILVASNHQCYKAHEKQWKLCPGSQHFHQLNTTNKLYYQPQLPH